MDKGNYSVLYTQIIKKKKRGERKKKKKREKEKKSRDGKSGFGTHFHTSH